MGPPSKIMSEAEKVQTFKNTAMNATIEMQTRVFISTDAGPLTGAIGADGINHCNRTPPLP